MQYEAGPDIMSRKHAFIQRMHGDWFELCDLNSSNGTYVNANKLVPHARYVLKPGDRISFCGMNTVTLDGGVHENPYVFVFDDEPVPASVVTPVIDVVPQNNLEVHPNAAPDAAPVTPRPFRPRTPERQMETVKDVVSALAESSTCAVCMEVAVAPHALRQCSHIFCGECIATWITTRLSSGAPLSTIGCPTCRAAPATAVRMPAWENLLHAVYEPTLSAEDYARRNERARRWHETCDAARRERVAVERARKRVRELAFGDASPHELAMRATRVPLTARYSIGRIAFATEPAQPIQGPQAPENEASPSHDGVVVDATPAEAAVANMTRRRHRCATCRDELPFGSIEVVDYDSNVYHPRCVPSSLYGRRLVNTPGPCALRDDDFARLRAMPFVTAAARLTSAGDGGQAAAARALIFM
jgi:hypothetical protein